MRSSGAFLRNAVTGHEVATSLDGRLAFVPTYGNSIPGKSGTDGDEVVVIDLVSQRVIHRIRFTHGVRPHDIVMNPHDGLLYVTTELDNSVSIIDPRSFVIVGAIPTGRPQSHMLALSHDGRFGYTANIESGTVSVLDLRERKLIDVVPVSGQVQRISISTDDEDIFTADQTQPRLAIINAVHRTLRGWVALPDIGYGSGSTPDGTRLLVTLPNSSCLAVIDLRSLKIIRSIAVPRGPHEVLISPDGTTAYVACITAGAVAMIDLKTWSVKHVTKVGKLCDGIGWSTRTEEKTQ